MKTPTELIEHEMLAMAMALEESKVSFVTTSNLKWMTPMIWHHVPGIRARYEFSNGSSWYSFYTPRRHD